MHVWGGIREKVILSLGVYVAMLHAECMQYQPMQRNVEEGPVICINSDSMSTLSHMTSKLQWQCRQILCVMSWNKRLCFAVSLATAGFGVMRIWRCLGLKRIKQRIFQAGTTDSNHIKCQQAQNCNGWRGCSALRNCYGTHLTYTQNNTGGE